MKTYYLILALVFFADAASAGIFNSTEGNCSPIVNGDTRGDIIIKCSDKNGQVKYSVGVYNIKKNEINPNPLQYKKIVNKGVIEIHPQLYGLTPASPIFHINHHDYHFIYPNLDIKISNNTDNTVIVDGGFIEVLRSNEVKEGNLELSSGECGNIEASIFNHGNAEVKDLSFYYNIEPIGYQAVHLQGDQLKLKDYEITDKFQYKRVFKSVNKNDSIIFNIDQELQSMGVNFNGLTINDRGRWEDLCSSDISRCSMKKIDLGVFGTQKDISTFSHKDARVYGYFEYKKYDHYQERMVVHRHKTDAIVEFFPILGCGASLNISDKFSYKLRSTGQNYEVPMDDISNFIKPSEADRILISVSTEYPTFHIFKIHLHTVEYGYLPSQTIKVFIPAFQ